MYPRQPMDMAQSPQWGPQQAQQHAPMQLLVLAAQNAWHAQHAPPPAPGPVVQFVPPPAPPQAPAPLVQHVQPPAPPAVPAIVNTEAYQAMPQAFPGLANTISDQGTMAIHASRVILSVANGTASPRAHQAQRFQFPDNSRMYIAPIPPRNDCGEYADAVMGAGSNRRIMSTTPAHGVDGAAQGVAGNTLVMQPSAGLTPSRNAFHAAAILSTAGGQTLTSEMDAADHGRVLAHYRIYGSSQPSFHDTHSASLTVAAIAPTTRVISAPLAVPVTTTLFHNGSNYPS